MGIWGGDGWRLEKSENKDNVNIVIGAYRSILHPIAYMSLPITSGKRCYEVLDKHKVKSMDELIKKDKDLLYGEIIKPNIEEGLVLAERLAEKSVLPVVAPSIFEAKKQRWGQNDYMFMWFRVIEEKARKMYMKNGWEYSNGGSEEFVRAMEMQFGFINPSNGMEHFPKGTDLERVYKELRQIKVFNEDEGELRLHDGFKMIKKAVLDLKERGFSSPTLCESLEKLATINAYFEDPMTVCVFDREAFDRIPYEVEKSVNREFFGDKELMNFAREIQGRK